MKTFGRFPKRADSNPATPVTFFKLKCFKNVKTITYFFHKKKIHGVKNQQSIPTRTKWAPLRNLDVSECDK